MRTGKLFPQDAFVDSRAGKAQNNTEKRKIFFHCISVAVTDPSGLPVSDMHTSVFENEPLVTEEPNSSADLPGAPHAPAADSETTGTTPADIVSVAGCEVQLAGPMQFFLTNGYHVSSGDRVIVETESGQGVAKVLLTRPMRASSLKTETTPHARRILGRAKAEDIAQAEANNAFAVETREYCETCIRDRQLNMKLVEVEVALDKSKVLFYFTAPSRIDFRELVKDLVRKFRTRIELRQIGVRHETQMLGAVGNCGMVCCCRRYLRNFAPVAIKMAKEQNVFLNPAKISGICGRLLCCLAYEQDNYDEFYRRCPKLGKKYHTARGLMRVLRASMFRESIIAVNEMNEEVEFTLEEWQTLAPRRSSDSAHQQLGKLENDNREGVQEPPLAVTPDLIEEVPFVDSKEDNEEGWSIFGLVPRKPNQAPSPEVAGRSEGGHPEEKRDGKRKRFNNRRHKRVQGKGNAL